MVHLYQLETGVCGRMLAIFIHSSCSSKLATNSSKIAEGMKTPSLATIVNVNDSKLRPSLAMKERKVEQAVAVHYLALTDDTLEQLKYELLRPLGLPPDHKRDHVIR